MNPTFKRIKISRRLQTTFARSGSVISLLLWSAAALAPVHAQQYEISTYAGGIPAPRPPVVALKSSLGAPSAVGADPAGNVYFTVRDLNSVFKLDPSGLLTRV